MSFPEQPFGFVAGRWVRSIGDTPDDADRAPDYIPVETGTVVFTPQVTHRVAPDATGWAGIIKERIPARLGERGQLIDAEGHDHLALAAGIYSVSYDFGSGRSWPSHYIEVRTDHTSSSPLWLPPIAPPPVGPMIENRVVTLPEGGRDGQVLVWDGAGFSWADPPRGPEGPKGDLDAEQLAGAPRLTNRVHDMEWRVEHNATIESQEAGAATFTATAQGGEISRGTMPPGRRYYFTAEVKTTSDQVYIGAWESEVFHSGSGDWERLTGIVAPYGVRFFSVKDTRTSGWDQIEVRNPVQINLTEVFGAGREPTKEYMDALMAKHDHYIGDVDQFAFGDALQALTVAGPGMTLRHDNSVGERVFLDHPGGSTMLHGDTGWRTLTSWDSAGTVTGTPLASGLEPIAGASGSIAFRRRGPEVMLSIYRARFTGGAFIPIPVGFRPGGAGEYANLPRVPLNGTVMLRGRAGNVSFFVDAETKPAEGEDSYRAMFRYITSTAWPTTLPGTPG